VLVQWDLRHLYAKLIDDVQELDWFLANVVTEAWHFEHDAGRDLAEMVAQRQQQFPGHAHLIDAYAARFGETIPGPVPGTHELVRKLAERGTPLFAITNFAAPFWAEFRPTDPVFELFGDIVVSGIEKMAKPNPQIFELAAQRFGIGPAEMLFIDDNAVNIEAAGALGWHVHLFTDAATLSRDPRVARLLA
ncbi:MAG: HAD-IA family hydrolase, partial [Sphingomonadaceae bacterium]|nr:HAD-IA family hydrolase [Sphingomonadaceae bacterium]